MHAYFHSPARTLACSRPALPDSKVSVLCIADCQLTRAIVLTFTPSSPSLHPHLHFNPQSHLRSPFSRHTTLYKHLPKSNPTLSPPNLVHSEQKYGQIGHESGAWHTHAHDEKIYSTRCRARAACFLCTRHALCCLGLQVLTMKTHSSHCTSYIYTYTYACLHIGAAILMYICICIYKYIVRVPVP